MRQSILYLIRHGETQWNAESRLQGKIDIPLNDMGKQQARLAAEEFQHHPFTAIYSSPLQRAHETAQIINGHHRHEIRLYPDLMEASYGSMDGTKREVYAEAAAAAGTLDRHGRFRFKLCSDAESYHDVYERVKPVLDEIIQNHAGETVLVVSHGAVMRAIIAMVADLDVKNVRIQNTGYVKLVSEGAKTSLEEHKRVIIS